MNEPIDHHYIPVFYLSRWADTDQRVCRFIPTPRQTIWIDLMTGEICAPEPIEHGDQVIPFTAPRSRLREKSKYSRLLADGYFKNQSRARRAP